MNFADSLKQWFFNNSSQAASSDARIPLLNANGTPKGSDTMENIASALGIGSSGVKMTLLDRVDISTLSLELGYIQFYIALRTCTNMPIQGSDGYVICFRWPTGNYATQIFVNPNVDKVFIRSQRGSGTWEPWKEL